MSDNLPQRRGEKTIASFSKEATAEFLAGGEIGRPKWSDPKEQQRQDLQRERLRAALGDVTRSLSDSLEGLSPQAASSLRDHYNAAMGGDVQSYRMYCAMLAELGKQALQP